MRRLLREIELRGDIRANAIFSLMLYTGVHESRMLLGWNSTILMLGERSGSIVVRNGKGNKQRSVPLPLPARRALESYMATRPPVASSKVFIGERGPLTNVASEHFATSTPRLPAFVSIRTCSAIRWHMDSWRPIREIWCR